LYRIKNWQKFQHYKDRRPVWIKLYPELLDDIHGYLALSDRAKVTLFHCWMAGAMIWEPEKEVEPLLPRSLERLRLVIRTSFRTTSARTLNEIESAGYLLPVSNDYNNLHTKDASITLAEKYVPKIETYKTEKTNAKYTKEFLVFWEAYPLKKGKGQAFRSWKSISNRRPNIGSLIEIIDKQKEWPEFNEYTPMASTWLSGDRWEDEPKQKTTGRHPLRSKELD